MSVMGWFGFGVAGCQTIDIKHWLDIDNHFNIDYLQRDWDRVNLTQSSIQGV